MKNTMTKLKTLAVAGVAAAMGLAALPAQAQVQIAPVWTPAETKVYDLEHHFYVPEFFEYMATRTTPPFYRPTKGDQMGYLDVGQNTKFTFPDETIALLEDLGQGRIDEMDKAGVDVAVMSSLSLIEGLPREESIRLAKLSNDRLYEMSTNFPGRILGTAMLPTVWVDDATNELERCVKQLGFKYWQTHDHYMWEDEDGNGHTNYLWEDRFKPILAKANELGLAIYIHPDYQLQPRYDYGRGYMTALLGFGQGAMQTVTKFVLKGRLDEYPNIRLIVGHLGEYFPYVLERMDNRFFDWPQAAADPKPQKRFSEYFREGRITVTTSGQRFDPSLKCAKRAIGVNRIAFASDWPFEPMTDSVNYYKNTTVLTDAEKAQVFEKTAKEEIWGKNK